MASRTTSRRVGYEIAETFRRVRSENAETLSSQPASTELRVSRRGVGKRGPTKAKDITSRRTKMQVLWRDLNIVGEYQTKAGTWCGLIVRNETICPIMKGWAKVDDEHKDMMYQTFVGKFEWPDEGEGDHRDDVLELMKARYRDYRCQLRKKFGYLVGKSAASLEAATATAGAPSKEVLQYFIERWQSPEFKAMSARGKANRGKAKRPPFVMRQISMPQCAFKMEQRDGHRPIRVDLYEASRMTADGKFRDNRVPVQVAEMREIMKTPGQYSDKAMDAVLGPPSHGRVLCTALGITPTYYAPGKVRASPSEKIVRLQQQLEHERETRETMECRFREESKAELEAMERRFQDERKSELDAMERRFNEQQQVMDRKMAALMAKFSDGGPSSSC